METEQDWEIYIGLPFFTMPSITWCCWRCRGFMLFALTQSQKWRTHKHESCWRQARSGRSLAPCPDLTSTLEANGVPDNPLSALLGYRTTWTFLPSGMWAACCSTVAMDDAVMKRLFWDECCHSSQMEFLQGRYIRLSSWGKCMSRGGTAAMTVRDELQGFAVRECRWKPSHLKAQGMINKG